MKKITAAVLSIVLVAAALLPSALAGGGGIVNDQVNINAIMARKMLEEQVRQRVARVQGGLYNSQNNYYAESAVNADGWADLIINDPAPGAYSCYVFGQEYSEQLGRYITRLEGHSEVVIGKGENIVTPELTLSEWQDVVVKLPARYTGSEENFSAEFMVGGQRYGTFFYLSADKQYLVGMISVNATSDISLIFNGRKYAIPLEIVIGSIGWNKPMLFDTFISETLTTLAIRASVMEDYIVVPTEVATIKAAMEFAQAGQTVLVKPGFYGDNFMMKAGVRLMGNPSRPEGVVIESNQPWTVKTYGVGKYEIVGVTIKNIYGGDERSWSTGAVVFDAGSDVRMRHSIVESTGVGNGIVTNYTSLQLTNITFKGSGANTALQRYNNNFNESLENLLFYNWAKSAVQSNGQATVKNSLFWQAPEVVSESNVSGDPQFLKYNSGLRPSINSPAVQQIMKQSGNYPGALSPQIQY